ncbi:transferrin-binding protein-like solute binding protein [Actinobacillus equuli subsp. haemolyticus]|uniref:transferrin-binding protein-like solute binding protein n=1 Tax=Actinobacillus equuli TaxID=718 RepID=UPI0024466D02|nr:transferrin-binding protein-like solute binding protein [Actinobacillus equuli]WGE50125.1 transferrin-binding protein-like solute binding protein [Actinobacillus equuli subsp. haemolyticus]
MNKNLRLSLIAIACSLAITACSSDNKGATRYENLVKNKTEEATKRAEEKAKRAQESDIAKKLADLEKKQKELEAELAKKQNGNTAAPSVSGNVPSNVITPSTPAKEQEITKEKPTEKKESRATKQDVQISQEKKDASIQTILNSSINNGSDGTTRKLSGSVFTSENGKLNGTNISPNNTNDITKLAIGDTVITLFKEGTFTKGNQELPTKTEDINKTTDIMIEGKPAGKAVGLVYDSYTRSNYIDMKYGYVTKNGKTSLFIQGNMTPTAEEISTSGNISSPKVGAFYDSRLGPMRTDISTDGGVWSYIGKAFVGKDNNYREYNVNAEVDFITAKKVKVNLTDIEQKEKNITFGGNISGNTFSGEVDGIITKGAFYGSNAINLGGVFYNTNNAQDGVFGATQEQASDSDGTPSWKVKKDTSRNLSDYQINDIKMSNK